MAKAKDRETVVVTALQARTNFGKLLRRVENERRSLVIEKRGTPRAVLLSIRDYIRLAAPEPEVLRIIGEESGMNKTDKLTSQQIDEIIKEARAAKRKTKRK
ncbi:MAG TPA: type II toxin-antitoxin system Phd/YefM family antitoxin [Candidatus Acidoferrales bacterium]|nr:type II toxin-antitoxin system Phd/YefM family antitoxin [Candidatus Acidoferrales bacterium]